MINYLSVVYKYILISLMIKMERIHMRNIDVILLYIYLNQIKAPDNNKHLWCNKKMH